MDECALALAELALLVQHKEMWRKVRALGVRIFEHDNPLDSLCAEPVVFHGEVFSLARYLQDATGAVLAVLIPAYDEFGELADIAAWQPDTNKIALWQRAVAMLGQEYIYDPRFYNPLLVHESVVDWLRNRRRGVYLVNPFRAALLFAHHNPTLGVRSENFGRRLRTTLIIPAPRVLVQMSVVA